ncbi:HD domain-containing protein, partial [Bacteroidota bacterium]
LKIINDPIYGFINLRHEIIYHLVEHPVFQRLRRIKQLGMTNYVYPGANHTRFQHALGAMHLMGDAIDTIRRKGHEITLEEAEAVSIAILLHDIGHGPFSHTLESTLIRGFDHEKISLMLMEQLNEEFEGRLSLAITIFKNNYKKKYLHQLVSGQLDVDRLDYLRRDSFFTGVTEGTVGSDRIIKMLEVRNDRLVVEEKGIYSIEKFLVARRLMFWQVYMHKGVLASDELLIQMLKRAHHLASEGEQLFATPALGYFLYHMNSDFTEENKDVFLSHFTELDDNDIISAAKVWSKHPDPVLSYLCTGFIQRKLFRVELSDVPIEEDRIKEKKKEVADALKIDYSLTSYLVISQSISNHAYKNQDDNIQILGKDGDIRDIQDVSEIMNISVLSANRNKYYLTYPKFLY